MIATILIVFVMTLRLVANLVNNKEERFAKLFFFTLEMSVFYAAGLFDKFF